MNKFEIKYSFLEQFMTSLFTFLSLYIATKYLSIQSLGFFTSAFSINQSLSFILFGLILLPLSSSKNLKYINTSFVYLIFLNIFFIFFCPLALYFFDAFKYLENKFLLLFFLNIYFVSYTFFEYLRWLSIKLNGPKKTFIISLFRFSLFIFLVFWNDLEFTSGKKYVNTIILVNFLSIFLLFYHISDLKYFKIKFKNIFYSKIHFSILGNSVTSFICNFFTIVLLNNLSGSLAISAYQTIKSITNPIGMVGQIIDNHLASYISNLKNFNTVNNFKIFLIIGTFFIIILSIIFGKKLESLIFNNIYDDFWYFIPLLVIGSLSHTLTRPIFVDWRVNMKNKLINFYSLFTLLMIIPTISIFYYLENIFLIILISSIYPLISFFLYKINKDL